MKQDKTHTWILIDGKEIILTNTQFKRIYKEKGAEDQRVSHE